MFWVYPRFLWSPGFDMHGKVTSSTQVPATTCGTFPGPKHSENAYHRPISSAQNDNPQNFEHLIKLEAATSLLAAFVGKATRFCVGSSPKGLTAPIFNSIPRKPRRPKIVSLPRNRFRMQSNKENEKVISPIK